MPAPVLIDGDAWESILSRALKPTTADTATTAWIADDQRHVWHPYTQMATAPAPIPLIRADGVYLYTADGRKILDGISSWWVNIHGHNHPRLNRALTEQLPRLAQVIFAGFTHEPAARLAGELARRTPGQLERVFYSDDGSTAVEVALKMAYQHWRHRGEPERTLFVALDNAYHGDTFGAMAAGSSGVFHQAFRDLLFEVRRARLPGRTGGSGEDLAAILEQDGHRIAAVLVEPMLQGAGGMNFWPASALREVRDLTRAHGTLLIADEILTGFGRTGELFACEHGPVVPDILCLSKALTGGYLPLGATLTNQEVFDSFLSDDRTRTFFHGHSYTGNALACAVALESLRLFDDERRLDRVRKLATLFALRLEALRGCSGVVDVRGLGAIAVVELAAPGTAGYLSDIGPRLGREFLERGILLRPLGNVLYFMPPYVITDDEAHWVFDEIERALAKLIATP